MMAKNIPKMPLPKLDDLFTTEEERTNDKLEKVIDIKLSDIDDFPDHPFKVIENEDMYNMRDSIKENGVLVPALVRKKPDGRYEMVSGHRRKYASQLANNETLPCIVRDLTDDEAVIIMVDSNLQREEILPSEKAFAYKMKLEALTHQGKRTDLTCDQLGDKLNNKKYEVNFPDLIKTAEESRPALLAAKKAMDAAELNVRAAKRAFTPDVSGFAGYDHGGRQINNDYGYQFGVQLNYTAMNLMLLKKQVDEAKATYNKAVADYEQQKQNVYLEVKSAYINLLNSHDSLDVAKLALQQAKERQYLAFRRYQVGLGDAIEFKDSENTYLNAQLDYYNNLLNYNINAAELERVIGAPIKESDIDL